MKKIILMIIVCIGLIFTGTIETKAQTALNVQAGYSWSEGIISAGYQQQGLEAKVGYMMTTYPGDGSSLTGPTFTIILGPNWDESGTYLSYCYNSVGYRSQYSINGGSYGSNYYEAMNILSVGYKYGSDFMYMKFDIGYGWSANGKGMSYGIVIGVPLFGSY